uniref:WGS project CBMI000000000 data, contig CS3069_c002324 n=1 Tax=Fusarium clavum TaxID=2594811 RepID=A0A090MIQ8_9HYPO|nr:unnamed protein product [Fusarium clavum]
MSTASDIARVFVEEEEETFSLFTYEEQTKLDSNKYNPGILDKINGMSFQQYEWETMFLFFFKFVAWIIRGHKHLSVPRSFALVKAFALRETMMAQPIQVEITPQGHVFYEDNPIAL